MPFVISTLHACTLAVYNTPSRPVRDTATSSLAPRGRSSHLLASTATQRRPRSVRPDARHPFSPVRQHYVTLGQYDPTSVTLSRPALLSPTRPLASRLLVLVPPTIRALPRLILGHHPALHLCHLARTASTFCFSIHHYTTLHPFVCSFTPNIPFILTIPVSLTPSRCTGAARPRPE